MHLIRFDANGMFEEAKKNFKSEFSVLYTKEDVAAVWKAVFKFVLNHLNTYTGVEIPNLGTFTFAELYIREQGQIKVKPYFLVSRYLRQMYLIKQAPHQSIKYVKNDVRVTKLNTTTIADHLNIHSQSAEVCVKEVLAALSRLLKDGKNVDFPMPGIGVLQFRNKEVTAVFRKDLVRNLFLTENKELSKKQEGTKVDDCSAANVLVKTPMVICDTVAEQCLDEEPMLIQCRPISTNKIQCRIIDNAINNECEQSCCVIGKTILLPPKLPPGELITPMEANFYDSNNIPTKLPPKNETFFEKVPITLLLTKDQVEIALGEVDEFNTKKVCPKCANGMRNNIKYEYAYNNTEKIDKVMQKVGCGPAVYDDTADKIARLRRNKEVAEYNKCLEKLQDQQKKVRYCEPPSNLFYNRPSSGQRHAEKEKKYRNELREMYLQREAERKAEEEEKFCEEVEARERSLELIREDIEKEKEFTRRRMEDLTRGNQEYLAEKIRRHNERYCQEYLDPNRYKEDPHLFFQKTVYGEATSKEEYIKNTDYNLAKAAVQKKNECLAHQRKLCEELQVLGKVKEMCKNNPVRLLKKQLQAETVAGWEKAKRENDEKGEEVLERLRQPTVGLLDTLCNYKRCGICKRNLQNTGGNIEGVGIQKFIV